MSKETTLARVLPHTLPDLKQAPTPNQSSRHGRHVRLVVIHRWGERYVSEKQEENVYEGVINFFKSPHAQASAHIVYPGSAHPGQATQMVPWKQKAWTEAFYNPDSVEVESADAIWLGHDPAGFHQLAHIAAWMLHHWRLPPVGLDSVGVVHGSGFCRHADLGALGGGHTSCPSTDHHLWASFENLVISEYHRMHPRPVWGVS